MNIEFTPGRTRVTSTPQTRQRRRDQHDDVPTQLNGEPTPTSRPSLTHRKPDAVRLRSNPNIRSRRYVDEDGNRTRRGQRPEPTKGHRRSSAKSRQR